ncbi:30S ribosomal protein S5, chloroplastic [Linum perenne]
MAATTLTLSSCSISLQTPIPRFLNLKPTSNFSFFPSITPPSLSFSTTIPRAFSEEINTPKFESEFEPEEETRSFSDELDTSKFESEFEPEEEIPFDPPAQPDGFIPPPYFDEGPPETEEEIATAYEEMYGPAYSGETMLGGDIYVMDKNKKKLTAFGKLKRERVRDGFEERVIQVRRVTKVVKGGKQLHFRAVVVVGNKQGQVGVGVGKAKEVAAAVQKSTINARRNVITVPLTKYSTFPHRADGKFGAATVMLRPACPGSGVVAGGVVTVVLELAGVKNALGKQLGSDNILNNARAAIVAIQQMRQLRDVARDRGLPMEALFYDN